MDKYIGRLLDNRYEILEVIGTGGMAVVYKARCHRLNRLVAIKILKDDFLEDEEFRRRFHAESQAIAMLSHPNIVSVYDVSTSDDADYIVMELIDGISLKQYMEKKGVLNWKETLHFAIQIAKALEHAHSRGIVHRDIKPHNVMVLKNGSVKVSDFGIARMMSKGNTLTKEALGSVHYISPEQAKGGRVDNRSDIYSLGVVMYEMMSGRPPYDGETPVSVAIQHINGGAVMPSTLNPNIPGGLEQIIMKAMAHGADARYESAGAMLSDLDEFRKNPAILFDYNTPPIDAVTTLRPPAPIEPEKPKTTAERVVATAEAPRRRTAETPRRREPEKETSKSEEERRSRITTIAIISCSAVIVVAIAIFLIVFFSGGGSFTQSQVEVPNLVGQNYNEMEMPEDFEIKVFETVFHDTVPAGQIISHEPVGGTMTSPGNTIWVTVSRGPEPQPNQLVTMQGKSKEQAEATLKDMELGIKIVISEEHNDEIPAGYVVRTEPVAGTQLKSGDSVILYISKGPEATLSKMPNLVGFKVDNAKLTLENQDLDLDIQTQEVSDADIPEGEIVRTKPEQGEDLVSGQEVILYVSSGPKKATVRDMTGYDWETAKEYLEEDGFKNVVVEYIDSEKPEGVVVSQSHKKVTISVTTEIILQVSAGSPVEKKLTIDLPTGKSAPYTLQILVLDENGSYGEYRVFEKVAPTEKTMEVLLTGKGVQTFRIDIDGAIYKENIKVDFDSK